MQRRVRVMLCCRAICDFLTFLTAVGRALAMHSRPLVYGGGQQGLMGIVSNAALESGGNVTGVIPLAMILAGGEQDKTDGQALNPISKDAGRGEVCPFHIASAMAHALTTSLLDEDCKIVPGNCSETASSSAAHTDYCRFDA